MQNADNTANSDYTSNTAVGYEALLGSETPGNNTGTSNTAVGDQSLRNNTSGSNNTACGVSAQRENTSGADNTALGYHALMSNTSGDNNVAIGINALLNNVARDRSTAVGSGAMLYADNSASPANTYNTAVGYYALAGSNIPGNNTGTRNTAVGDNAMTWNTNGSANNHVANTAVGYMAGGKITTGYGNILIGEETGRNISTGWDNVWIGKQVGNTGTLTVDNTIVLGAGTAVPGVSNRAHIGDGFMSWIGGQVTWSTYSDARFKTDIATDIPGLEFILRLRPVSFNWDIDEQNRIMGVDPYKVANRSKDIEKVRITGFLAQEVEAAADACGYDFSGLDKAGGVYSLSYSQFVVPLVRAVQEQQEMIRQQDIIIDLLQSELEKLKSAVTAQAGALASDER